MRKKRKIIKFTVHYWAEVPVKTDISDLIIDAGWDGKIAMYENGGSRKVNFTLHQSRPGWDFE